METFSSQVSLPDPEMANLRQIDETIRAASCTANGRESLAKFLVTDQYAQKLVPLVEAAEEAHLIDELYRLNNIMKMMILLNDSAIIEQLIGDDLILGVVGALECQAFCPSTPPSSINSLPLHYCY